MSAFTLAKNYHRISVQTAEVELSFSLDDGGLCALKRLGGVNLLNHGSPQPAIDVKVGFDATWIAERVFVRHLRHTVREDGNAVVLEIIIGIGPLMITDEFRITGTLIARSVTVHNVSEDEIRLSGLRLLVPWVRTGELESCRFEAPGSSVRPQVPLAVAAAQRRGVLPRRYFAPGLRFNRTIEQAPLGGAGLMAVADQQNGETLLCWYSSASDPADSLVEGNGTAVTFVHEVAIAERLTGNAKITVGTQYVLLLRQPWPEALASFRRTALLTVSPGPPITSWPAASAIYEVHAAQCGGFRGLAARIGELRDLGIGTINLLPIWAFLNPGGQPWNEHWESGANPYAICDYEQLDHTLGSADDLCILVDAVHAAGMHVIIDLPMIGCALDSRHVREHPLWFCHDNEGELFELPEDFGICQFDWANQELQHYWVDQTIAQVHRYGFDGVRAVVAQRGLPNWAEPRDHHASAGRLATLHMLSQLRGRLRELREDCVLVSTLSGPASTADLCYDEQPHHQFMHLVLNRLSPLELGVWLEDDRATHLTPTPRATFVESYRTWQTNPLADGLRGSLLSHAALAALVFCGFTPVIRCGQEDTHLDFIQRLLIARSTQPILREGNLYLNVVLCDDPQVFCVVRSDGNTHMLGLIKIGARKRTATIRLPIEQIELGAGDYTLYDVIQRRQLHEGSRFHWNRDELLAFQLTLEPFEAYALIITPFVDSTETDSDTLPHVVAYSI